MIRILKIVLFGGLILMFGACSKSSDDAPKAAFTADAERGLGDPRFAFQQEQQDIKLESLSSSEASEIASCTQKSSTFRADKKKYSVSYGTLVRVVNNSQNMIMNQKYDYTTENKDEVYELTTSLLNYVIASQSILTNGPIVYRDFCSASSGCDQEKRKFISGTSSYLVNAKIKERSVVDDARLENKSMDCSITTATEKTNQLQKGQIKVGDSTYKALQILKKVAGKIYCKVGANRESLYLGEGVELSKTVYLQDQLVFPAAAGAGQISETGYNSPVGCARTAAFSSRELQFEGTTIIGESNELVDYQFTGTIQSIEDWNKKQADIKLKVANLKNEIIIKKSTLDRSQLNVSESENDLKSSESKLSDFNLQLNDAITGKKPNEDALRILVKDAQAAVDSAKARRDSAQTLLVTTQTQLKAAEDALAAYTKENGSGENQ